MSDAYLVSLCQDYCAYVDAMRGGQYTTEEIRAIDSQRQVVHDELCRITGKDRSEDMYAYARAVVRAGHNRR